MPTGAKNSWLDMKRRCLCFTNKSYYNYGGRGITIHPDWMDFKNFLRDMGPRPEGTSLDRINNNGNYEPGNCRWATRAEQNSNKRIRQQQANNPFGIPGVTWHKQRKKFLAKARNKELYAGPDFFEACCARKSWERQQPYF